TQTGGQPPTHWLKDHSMGARSMNTAKSVGKAALFLAVTSLLTLLGMASSWIQVEAPTTTRAVLSIVLLLPIAALSALFRSVSADGHLTTFTYRLSLTLGLLGQCLYYYAAFLVLRWSAAKLIGAFRHQ